QHLGEGRPEGLPAEERLAHGRPALAGHDDRDEQADQDDRRDRRDRAVATGLAPPRRLPGGTAAGADGGGAQLSSGAASPPMYWSCRRLSSPSSASFCTAWLTQSVSFESFSSSRPHSSPPGAANWPTILEFSSSAAVR